MMNGLGMECLKNIHSTSGIDKDTLDLLSQIIEEYER